MVYVDSVASQPLRTSHTEEYCSECCTKLLTWRSSSESDAQCFHRDLAELLECGKHCKLCRYLYNLCGESFISDLRAQYPSGEPIEVQVGRDVVKSCPDQHGTMESVEMWLSLTQNSSKMYEVRRFVACIGAGRTLHRAIWNCSSRIDIEARSSTIREWLDECKTQHADCRKLLDPNSRLAARILTVDRLGGQFSVKLVSTRNVDLHREDYVVLSHVWGGVDIPCKTTTENIDEYFTRGIEYDKLPRTFRDAVRITAAIEIRYLWIDCLCVIQDKEEDWQQESAKMASIFQGGILTLSATSAINSLEGCSLDAVEKPATQFLRPTESGLDFALRGSDYAGTKRKLQDQILDAPVHTRAWIFQEKMLSRRMLHTLHSQLFWQCATRVESEDGFHYKDYNSGGFGAWKVLDSHVKRLRNVDDAGKPVYGPYRLEQSWWFWVHDYMSRNLSVASDQYAAFAGVVRLHQQKYDDEPVVGLWRRNLALHLAWTVYRDEYEHKQDLIAHELRRPSWTWMSFKHGSVAIFSPNLEWHNLSEHVRDATIIYQAETVDVDVRWSGEPLTSEPTGTITLRGICSRQPRPKLRHQGRMSVRMLDPDVPVSTTEAKDFETLALVAYVQKSTLIDNPPFVTTIYLVVEPLEDGTYVRIGELNLWRSLSSSVDADGMPQGALKTIVLV